MMLQLLIAIHEDDAATSFLGVVVADSDVVNVAAADDIVDAVSAGDIVHIVAASDTFDDTAHDIVDVIAVNV